MKRRNFVKAISTAAAIAAVCPLTLAETSTPILYGDGIHDDTEALQAAIDGKDVRWLSGERVTMPLPAKRFLITDTLTFTKASHEFVGNNSTIIGVGKRAMVSYRF